MSLCRLVQAAGRANGNQAKVLKENTGSDDFKVRILTTPNDFDAIRNYPTFLEAIKDMMQGPQSLTLEQALHAEYPGKFDFSKARDVGAIKAKLKDIAQRTLNFKPMAQGAPPPDRQHVTK